MFSLTNADHFPDEAQVPLLFNFDGCLGNTWRGQPGVKAPF